jgi:hypothetical protein
LIILGCVDTTLGCNGVSSARAILVAKTIYFIAKLGKSRRSGTAREARANYNDFEFPLVGGVDQLGVHFVGTPFVGKWARGNFGI